jgi:nicotinamidase-related amidase
MKPALMIIDMQKEYFTGYAKESMTAAAEYINEGGPAVALSGRLVSLADQLLPVVPWQPALGVFE